MGSLFGPIITKRLDINSDKELKKYYNKQEQMSKILGSLAGFRSGLTDPDMQETSYEAYRQLWLYAPDEVIRSINEFYFSTGARRVSDDELSEADKALSGMILQLRKNIYGKTELKRTDYLIIRFTARDRDSP